MNQQELNKLKQWFFQYCRSFYTSDQADQRNILLKEEHTYSVCGNMAEIARDLAIEEGRAALAELVALFHDVGRFPQYHRYRTFMDSISKNHAALGASVLIRNNVLADLPGRERDLVLRAVTLHNVFSIPDKLDEETLLFLKMIRDADKLDIWRVFIDYYARPHEDRPAAAALGLPDTPEYSPDVLASLLRKEMVLLTALKTLNDFKLLQLAWIFDLNFKRSLQILIERSYIDKIAATLPDTSEIRQAIQSIRDYVEQRL
jgi:hypothetical protein